MKTLTVTLKQHTPLIHFQHDQYGATLRASEVKPKLDKFVLTKLGGGNYEEGINKAKNKGWLVGKGEYPALNYKMKIESIGDKEEFLIASYISPKKLQNLEGINVLPSTPYFAQEKENSKIINDKRRWNDIKCKGIKYDGAKVDIFSLTDSLVDHIGDLIQSFFITENFGTRQSKGFGCFTVNKILLSDNEQKTKNEESLLKDSFEACYKKELNKMSLNNIFSTIVEDYRWLKSGKSRPSYEKSELMSYGSKFKMRWDKKFLKENVNEKYRNKKGDLYKLLDNHTKKYKGIDGDEKYYYLRALLGLAGRYEFLLENPPEKFKKLIISVDGGEVERFKSPILFKVIGNVLYLVANPIPRDILGKEFSFYVSIQGDDKYKDIPIDNKLCTPEEFDLIDFLDSSMNKLGYNKI